MHQLAIAMLNYREQYGTFPPAYSTDKNGKPLHSWRVLLLPMLEEDELCTKIDFQQPWNSPKNRALADQMPEIFRCPSSTAGEDDACTSYVMIVGPSTISDGPTARTMDEITDGTSRTLLLVEVRDSGVNWMEPKDLDAQAISFKINDGKGRSISSPHEGGANVSMCDASVHFLRDTTDPKQVKAMTTIAGGEEVDLP